MQCWNCGFENLPGLAACGRCASRLNLAGVGVEPPRASRLRLGTGVIRAGNRLGAPVHRLGGLRACFRTLTPEPVCWPALAWSFIPGLGQIRTGIRRQGCMILAAWLVLLALTILSLATVWQPVFLMLMVAVHGLAVLAVMAGNLSFERWPIRIGFGLVVFAALNLAVYRPVRWLGGRFARAVVLSNVRAGGPLRSGDGLLAAGPWLRPDSFQRGDVVLYRLPAAQGGHYVMHEGYGVDRIVGMPGEEVLIDNGKLLINGRPPAAGQGPLAPQVPAGRLELTLTAGEYLIVGSQLNWNLQGVDQTPEWILLDSAVISHADVIGRVLLRVRPLGRFGRVE